MSKYTHHDTVVVASVQHTGTWFIIDMLKKHSAFGNQTQWKPLVREEVETPTETKPLLHIHLTGGLPMHPDDKFKSARNVISHALTHTYPTVIPMRDPVLSLISRHARHPGFDHMSIVKGLEQAVEIYSFNGYAFPIDIPDIPLRLNRVLDLFAWWGLNIEPAVTEYVKAWESPVYNRTSSKLKDDYLATGDIGPVVDAMPNEMGYLLDSEPIKDLLIGLGYGGYLSWL